MAGTLECVASTPKNRSRSTSESIFLLYIFVSLEIGSLLFFNPFDVEMKTVTARLFQLKTSGSSICCF